MHAITVLLSNMNTGFIHDEKGVTGRHYLSSSETEFGVVETVLAILSNTNLLS